MDWQLNDKLETLPQGKLLQTFEEVLAKFPRPITMVRNPMYKGYPIWPDSENWAFVFHKRWVALIEKSRDSILGPHKVKLYYQSYQVKLPWYWIATAQITNISFFKNEELLQEIRFMVEQEEFFISSKEAEKEVIL